jgi:hypothetical protein
MVDFYTTCAENGKLAVQESLSSFFGVSLETVWLKQCTPMHYCQEMVASHVVGQ